MIRQVLRAATLILSLWGGQVAAENTNLTPAFNGGAVNNPIKLVPTSVFRWTGTDYGQALLTTPNEVTWTGTTGNPGSPIPLGYYFHAGSLLDTSAAGIAAGAYVNLECFTGCKGGLTSYLGNTNIGQVPGVGGYTYFGAQFSMRAAASDGSGGGGHVTGLAISDIITNNATGWGTQYGVEIDVGTDAGSSSVNKHGILVVLSLTDAVQGSQSDAAYLAISQHAQTSTSGWNFGLDFGGGGRANLAFPISTTGTLIHASAGGLDGALTVGSLIDFSGIATVSNWIFNSVNFKVAGNGNMAFVGSAPVVSACGTSPSIDGKATNNSGTVTVGTIAAASCTVTFANSGYTTWNHCRVTAQTPLANFAYSYTKTVLTVTATSLLNEVFDYNCDGS